MSDTFKKYETACDYIDRVPDQFLSHSGSCPNCGDSRNFMMNELGSSRFWVRCGYCGYEGRVGRSSRSARRKWRKDYKKQYDIRQCGVRL